MQTLEQPQTSIASNNDIGPIAYGTWSGGRFMHFGEVLTEDHYHRCVALAYEQGIRIFITADVCGSSKADARISDIAFMVGFQSLSQFNRSFSGIVECPPTKFRKSELTKAKLKA